MGQKLTRTGIIYGEQPNSKEQRVGDELGKLKPWLVPQNGLYINDKVGFVKMITTNQLFTFPYPPTRSKKPNTYIFLLSWNLSMFTLLTMVVKKSKDTKLEGHKICMMG